jgi:glycosyltransferase involved in cell wall biosynthesis
MNVLMLNTFDDVAGADRAARRLQQGLRGAGVDARLLVHFRYGDGWDVICRDAPGRRLLRRLKLLLGTVPVRRYPNRPVNNFTPALLPDRLAAEVAGIDPDIVHLHWLGAGFCRIETLARFDRPLVWTLHDSWPFTGGCHVPGDCQKYRERCGACPVLGSTSEDDLSRRTWQRKERAWRDLHPTLVAPSRWLADCARASTLFRDYRVEVIPNGLDTQAFRPMDQRAARERLGLPQDRPVVLFGAVNALTDPNKGWQLLKAALRSVAVCRPNALAVLFGVDPPVPPPDAGLPLTFLGRLRDDASLAVAYAAADVFVVPSRQESFCQTAAEALACGTPVAAFGTTGLLDVVEHHGCGYLAQPYDSADLARGILWVLADRVRHGELSSRARKKVEEEFSLDRVAERYLSIYRELLGLGENGS